MNLEEAKKLFAKHHPDEAEKIRSGDGHPFFGYAACVWDGFKSALEVTGQLDKS